MSYGHFDTNFTNLRPEVSELSHIYEISAFQNFNWRMQPQNDVILQKMLALTFFHSIACTLGIFDFKNGEKMKHSS